VSTTAAAAAVFAGVRKTRHPYRRRDVAVKSHDVGCRYAYTCNTYRRGIRVTIRVPVLILQ